MRFLIGIVIVLAAVWCGGWFAASWWAENRISEIIEAQRERGLDIDCADRAVRGFPFTLGVGCVTVTIRQTDGSQIATGEVRTAASLTSPGEARAELDGPLSIQMGNATLEATWDKLEAFIDATFDGGFDITSFSFTSLLATSGEIKASASKGGGFFRPYGMGENATGGENLEGTILLDGVTADVAGLKLPPFSAELDAALEDGYRDIIIQQIPLTEIFSDGALGEIRVAKLKLPDGGKLVFAGPLQFDRNGRLSGKVSVGLANPEAVIAWARSISPALEQPVSLLIQSVAGMGAPKSLGGEDLRAIEFTIDKGEVRLGFFKIIDLPPLR